MDYKRIYQEFIADRKAKEPECYRGLTYKQRQSVGASASGEYMEHHHILPRSMGGTDDASNVVSLTAEDHFFAHFYLGHIYGGAMWRAIELMVGNPHRKSDLANNIEDFAELYAIAARKAADAQRNRMKKKYKNQAYKNNWLEKMAKFQEMAKANGYYTERNINRYSDPNERKKTGDAARKMFAERPELKIAASKKSAERWANKEYKNRLSETHKKRWLNPELRQQVSDSLADFWDGNDEARKHHSATSKKSWEKDYEKRVAGVRAGAKKKSDRLRSEMRKVVCSNEGIVFANYFEAAEWLKKTKKTTLKNPRDIEVVCKGKNKTAGGFRWAYAS